MIDVEMIDAKHIVIKAIDLTPSRLGEGAIRIVLYHEVGSRLFSSFEFNLKVEYSDQILVYTEYPYNFATRHRNIPT